MSMTSKKANGEASISASEIRAACELILASDLFVNAPRMCRLLRFLVEKVISGDFRGTSEYAIGIEVFDRPSSTYNTTEDPIVRVQVGRLRERLKTYYTISGAASDIEIFIPLGNYMPTIRRLDTTTACAKNACTLTIQPIKCIAQCEDGEPFTQGLYEELMHQLFRAFGGNVVTHPFFGITTNNKNSTSKTISCHPISHLLEGSVRIDSERIRVSIRLIDTSLGYVAWSEQFDRSTFFTITQQEELAVSICNALRHFLHA